MTEKPMPIVHLSVAEIAIIIAEEMTGTVRPVDADPAALLLSMSVTPGFQGLCAAASRAAIRVGDYVKATAETTRSLHKMGAI